MAIGLLGSRPVAVSAGDESSLRVWDLPTLAPIGEPVKVGGPIRAITTSSSPEHPLTLFVKVGRSEKTITVRRFQGQPLRGTSGDAKGAAIGRLNGRTVKVTAGDELHVVDAGTGREIGPRILLGEDNGVHALELVTLHGRLTAVVNDNGGDENEPGPDPLRFVDLASGRRLVGIDGDFATVRKARVNGKTVLLTVNRPAGSISIWDPVSRKQIGLLPGNPPAPSALGGESYGLSRPAFIEVSLAVGELAGRPIAITGGGDNTVRLWDLGTARQLAATVPPGHTDSILAIAVSESAGRPVAITQGWDGQTIQWDLATGRRVAAPPPDTYGSLEDIPAARLRDRTVVADRAGGGRFRDLVASSLEEALRARDERTAPWVTQVGDRTVLFGRDGARAWIKDLATGAGIGAPVKIGATTPLQLTTLAEIDDRPVLLVSLKGTTRILDFQSGHLLGEVSGVSSSESPIAVARVRCTTGVLTRRSSRLYFWDLRTGRRLTPTLRGHGTRVLQILTGRLGDIPIAVTAALGGEIRVWNLLDGRQIGDPLRAHNRLVVMALGYVNGHTVVLAGGKAEKVLMWDLGR
ncbi:WD40 repeat domain-containing protein [Microbispora triticiradicis]|uniref:WD40 repeat domain-containing protein n=1 Tax=Microbispora triticiradicis TaxID=2200763 RepID=UPI001AD79951|nr:WD40 repeat domain-containing protein [Microbispora triticiradicis]MBO4269839.1 hypothetical protein [Microbispora triticiradicis]